MTEPLFAIHVIESPGASDILDAREEGAALQAALRLMGVSCELYRVKPILAVAKRLFMIRPAEGARTITYLASGPDVEGKTGLYFEKNRPKVPSKLAQDDALADRLWAASARLVKLEA